ncbi:MAG: alpha/beta fold hydrolase [Candidatus Gracilibacteria bacterium]
MNKALLLHGWGGNSNENWLPWLQNELNKKLFDVYNPNLPNTDNPVLDEQNETIRVYSSKFKDGGYIIGHSLGCQLAVKYIEENKIKNSVIILVAPTYPGLAKELGKDVLDDSYESIEKYYNTNIDFESINKLKNKYYVFVSDNDPYINMENAKKYYSQLNNVNFLDFHNKGHFNKDAGVLEIKEIFNYINF